MPPVVTPYNYIFPLSFPAFPVIYVGLDNPGCGHGCPIYKCIVTWSNRNQENKGKRVNLLRSGYIEQRCQRLGGQNQLFQEKGYCLLFWNSVKFVGNVSCEYLFTVKFWGKSTLKFYSVRGILAWEILVLWKMLATAAYIYKVHLIWMGRGYEVLFLPLSSIFSFFLPSLLPPSPISFLTLSPRGKKLLPFP